MRVLVFSETHTGGRTHYSKSEQDVISLAFAKAQNNDFLFADGQWYVRSSLSNSRRTHTCDDELPDTFVPKELRLAALVLS